MARFLSLFTVCWMAIQSCDQALTPSCPTVMRRQPCRRLLRLQSKRPIDDEFEAIKKDAFRVVPPRQRPVLDDDRSTSRLLGVFASRAALPFSCGFVAVFLAFQIYTFSTGGGEYGRAVRYFDEVDSPMERISYVEVDARPFDLFRMRVVDESKTP